MYSDLGNQTSNTRKVEISEEFGKIEKWVIASACLLHPFESYKSVGRKLKLPDEESGAETESEQSDEELTRPSRLFEGSKPSSNSKHDTHSSDNETLTSANSSDFIVEDDNAIQLPPEFSMETHQDLSHQFKKIYQFFVHIAVQPGKKRAAYMQKQLQGEILRYMYKSSGWRRSSYFHV